MQRGFLPPSRPTSLIPPSRHQSRTGGRYVLGSHQSVSAWATLSCVPRAGAPPSVDYVPSSVDTTGQNKAVPSMQSVCTCGASCGSSRNLPWSGSASPPLLPRDLCCSPCRPDSSSCRPVGRYHLGTQGFTRLTLRRHLTLSASPGPVSIARHPTCTLTAGAVSSQSNFWRPGGLVNNVVAGKRGLCRAKTTTSRKLK